MKTMARQIGTVLCMALALLSAFYAFAVMKTHSGTGFWKVWLVIAAVFALLAVGIRRQLVGGAPRIIRGVIIAVVCIGIAIFGTVEGCIISNMHARGDQHLDYVVVLGAQVRKSGPSKALRYRLDTAADYLPEQSGYHLHRLRRQGRERAIPRGTGHGRLSEGTWH